MRARASPSDRSSSASGPHLATRRDARGLEHGRGGRRRDRWLRRARRDQGGERGPRRPLARPDLPLRALRRGRLRRRLTCGGTIAVAVYALDAALVPPSRTPCGPTGRSRSRFGSTRTRFGEQAARLRRSRAGRRRPLEPAARSLLELGESGIVETAEGDLVFVESYRAAAEHVHLRRQRPRLGPRAPWQVARLPGDRLRPAPVFLTEARFPDADALVDEWPDQFLEHAPVDCRTAILMMTHDLKFDVPALTGTRARTPASSGRSAATRPGTTGTPGCAQTGSARPISRASRAGRDPDRCPDTRGGRGHDRRPADRGQRHRPEQAHRLGRARDRSVARSPERRAGAEALGAEKVRVS